MNTRNTNLNWDKIWMRILWVAVSFAVLVCVLMIINYFQLSREDPVNTKTLDALVERLNQDPSDQELREEIRTLDPLMPVVFLTAKNQKEDRLKGLKIGADDYITKPFEAEELVLRLHNILRRAGKGKDGPAAPARLGKLEVRFNELMISAGKDQYSLTPREAELLHYLLEHPNTLLTREQILEDLWGKNDYFLGRSMDVFISRLRKYLQSEPSVSLETKRGVGFIFKVANFIYNMQIIPTDADCRGIG